MFLKENIKIIDNISLLEDIINFNEEYYNIKNDIILEEYKILVEGETFDKLKEKAKNLYTIIVNFLKRMWEKLKQVYYTIKNKIFGGWDSVIKKVNKEKEDSMFEVLDIREIYKTFSNDYSTITSEQINSFTNVITISKSGLVREISIIKNSIATYLNDSKYAYENNIKTFSDIINKNKEDYTILDGEKVKISKFMLDSQKQITNIMKLNSLLISKVSKYKIVENIQVDESGGRNKTLILVFGRSKFESIIELSNKKEFDTSDYELLKNYEWFWFGSDNKPKDISTETNGNMCWLEINMILDKVFEVKDRMNFIDLLDMIKKEQVTISSMKTIGLFMLGTSGLSVKGFKKA